MIKTIALFAVLLTGCVGNAYYECSTKELGGVLVEFNADCDAVRYNATFAVALLKVAGKGISADWSLPTYIIEDSPRLRETGTFLNEPNEIGFLDMDPQPVIHLAADGTALVHEMIHFWQLSNGVLDTNNHPDWCEKGYGGQFVDKCPGSLSWFFVGNAHSIRNQ